MVRMVNDTANEDINKNTNARNGNNGIDDHNGNNTTTIAKKKKNDNNGKESFRNKIQTRDEYYNG